MKNTFLKLGLTTFAIMGMAACGQGPDNVVTIVFKHRSSSANDTILRDLAASYMASHPGTNIVIDKYGGNYDELLADNVSKLSAGDEYPDICECYPDHVERYFSFPGKVLEITDNYNALEQDEKDDFVSKFIEENATYSIPGMYSMPFSKSTEVIFYNEIILNKDLGPTVNDGKPVDTAYLENLTWEELFGNLCPAIVEYNEDHPDNKLYDDTDVNSCIFGYDSDDNLFITLCEQYGTGYTSVNQETGRGELYWNNANIKSVLKMFSEAKAKKYFQTSGTLGDYVNTLFCLNKCLFSVGSTGGYSYQCKDISFQIGVAEIPQAGDTVTGTTKKDTTISQGPSVCFFNHRDQRRADLAWDFYHELVQTKINTDWTTKSGYMFVKESVKQSTAYQNYINSEGKPNPSLDYTAAITMSKAQGIVNKLFYSPTFKGSSESRAQVGGLVKALLNDTTLTPAQIDVLFNEAENTTRTAMGD